MGSTRMEQMNNKVVMVIPTGRTITGMPGAEPMLLGFGSGRLNSSWTS